MILHAAALALAISGQAKVPYRLIATTEVRSPVPPSGRLIRSKRKAYEFFMLVRKGAKQPVGMKSINWRRQSVLAVFPGLIQKDAKLNFSGVTKNGNTLYPKVSIRRGITAETYYPVILVSIPLQSSKTEVEAMVNTISVVAMRRR